MLRVRFHPLSGKVSCLLLPVGSDAAADDDIPPCNQCVQLAGVMIPGAGRLLRWRAIFTENSPCWSKVSLIFFQRRAGWRGVEWQESDMGSGKSATPGGMQKQALKDWVLAGRIMGSLAILSVALCSLGARASEMIGVTLDQAKLVKLPEGTSTVVVGNPSIADISVQRNGVMVITGRRAGRTNFIALDKQGSIISESNVSVSVSTAGRVLLQRGVEATTYDCSTECLPTVGLGDDDKSFNRALSQASSRAKEARESTTPAR
jgi:Pilus formation protein N terminal region